NDVNLLVSLVTEHMMKPLYPHFPSVSVELPTAEMSKAELEFNWELLGLTASLLQRMAKIPGSDSVLTLRREYWQEMCKRVQGATIGPSFQYPQGETIDWTSINIAFMSDILRGAKALHFLRNCNYFPVSSFTECDFLLDDPKMPKSARDLFRKALSVENPDHLFYRLLFSKMLAQKYEFIVIAFSRFLEQRQNSDSPPDSLLIYGLTIDKEDKESALNRRKEVFSKYMKQFSELHLNMPENFNDQLHLVTSEIDNLKGETAKKYYQLEVAVAEISEIVAATPHSLGFVPQDVDLPFETTLLFELLPPQDVYPTEISPALALAAEYHLLLLWRCMQQLSLLVWFRSR
ncbi:hypothetical protein SeLEV6574_g08563, partial [Synchytrium endobioticum]